MPRKYYNYFSKMQKGIRSESRRETPTLFFSFNHQQSKGFLLFFLAKTRFLISTQVKSSTKGELRFFRENIKPMLWPSKVHLQIYIFFAELIMFNQRFLLQ